MSVGSSAGVGALDLDLEVFSGPFDLLLTLVLREEVDLLELELAEVVLAYLDHLERSGELDLESATEFIVLIAALLELKSRLMLTGEDEQLLDIEPGEAAEELLARMLDARRYRAAGEHLTGLLAAEHGVRFRAAPLPPELRRTVLPAPDGSQDPTVLGAAIGRLLAMPPTIDVRHIAVARVSIGERLTHLRELLRRGSFSFEEAVRGADRMTVAVTLFALLELYKRGEASWEQDECFGEIAVSAVAPHEPQLTVTRVTRGGTPPGAAQEPAHDAAQEVPA
jgi:segregation and condensation protein A